MMLTTQNVLKQLTNSGDQPDAKSETTKQDINNQTSDYEKHKNSLYCLIYGLYGLKGKEGSLSGVKRFFDNKGNVNEKSSSMKLTGLHAAALTGNVEAIKFLLEAKAEINPIAHQTSEHNSGGTPLDYATQDGHKDAIDVLVRNGAKKVKDMSDEEKYDRKNLYAFMHNGNLAAVKRLLAANVNVNAAASDQKLTALHAAALTGNVEAIKFLLEAKAEINSCSEFGTPLDCATTEKYQDAIDVLVASGATPAARI